MKKLLFCASLLLSSLCSATAINEGNFLTELEDARLNHEAAVNSVAWLACGGKKYIASGGEITDSVGLRLLEFDIFNNIVTEVSGGVNLQPDGEVNSVAWLKCGDKKYLATGGDVANTLTTYIYRFSKSNTQLQQKSSVNNASNVNSVAWIDCGASGKWLAEGSDTGGTNIIGIRKFNTQTEVLAAPVVPTTSHAQNVNSVAWCVAGDKKFLAIGGVADATVTTRLYLLTHNPSALTLQTGANQVHGATVSAVDWVDCDGTKYLATGGNAGTGGFHVRVYKLDADTPNLTDIAQFTGDSKVVKIDWLNCGGTKYLAITDVNGATRVLKFDATEGSQSLTEVAQVAGILSIDPAWLQCGALTYLTTGGSLTNSITNRVFEVDFNDDAINKLLRSKYFQLHGNNAPDVPFLEVPVT